MQIKVTLSKIMEVDEDTLSSLKEAQTDNDISSLLEISDLDSDSTISIEELE